MSRMGIRKYLNIPAFHQRFITDDNEFKVAEYVPRTEEPNILCSREGDVKYIPSGEKILTFNVYTYITLEKIEPRDLLDGQVVTGVNPVYEFNGKVSYYESKVGGA